MAYIGKSPDGTGVRARYYFTATGGETSLSGADDNAVTLSFADGAYVDVYLNGVLLVAGTDYNTTTTNTISGLSSLAANDIVEILVYDIFTVADTVSASAGGTFSGAVGFSGGITGDVDFTGHVGAEGGNAPTGGFHIKDTGGTTRPRITNDASDATVIRAGSATGNVKFNNFANTTELVHIKDDGKVGIGTSSPVSQMTLAGTSDLVFTQNGYGIAWGGNNGSPRIYGVSSGALTFKHGGGSTAMTIDTSGRVGLGGTGLALSPSAMITMESSDPPLKMYRTVTNAAFTCIELRSNSGSTNRHVFSVLADGDVLNVNNSYGALSDASLKENVSAAASQWDDIKAVQVKKYSMIADNVDAANRLGVIAQDLEASGMTGLVEETEDGTKTVKYSVLYMKAFKALQEAMDRIETLETSNADLTARIEALETGS